ncbi:helix-turn-helix domain-containing protein [Oscillospiraceae bacterium 50-60]|jgi:transposase-like protein
MPHKEKLKVQEKIDLIRRCQTGELGKTEASRIAGVDLKTIYHWLSRYEAEGESGFMAYSRNRVYTPEAKLNAVRDYLSGKGSQLEICKKYKIRNTHCLRGWIKVYNAHGDFSSRKYSGGGSYMKQGRTTTQEERVQIAKECIASGKNYGEIAQKYQVSYQQVRTWTLRFEELGEAGLEDRRGRRKKDQTPRTELEEAQIEIEQLKHKLYLAEMENTLLKKLNEIEGGSASPK